MITNTFTTENGAYHVETLGNGWAYSVTCQRTGKNFFVQEQAADMLQRDTDDFTCMGALDNYMEALGGEA